MPEVTSDATLLIATSWQALGRAESGDEKAMICNCTVIIVFAAFYIEANLTHIIELMGINDDLLDFANNDRPGLGTKAAFLYKILMMDQEEITKKKLYSRLASEYPAFVEIYNFRNDVAHGEVDRELATLENARRLRSASKDIVAKFIDVAKNAGSNIDRGITYEFAIASEEVSNSSVKS